MGVKKNKKTGKKKPVNNKTSVKYTKYKIGAEGQITRNAKFCPRCGPGVFLMNSQGRTYCGKCHYSEFESKKVSEKPAEVKAE